MAEVKDLKVKIEVETDELTKKLEIIKKLLEEINEMGINVNINLEK